MIIEEYDGLTNIETIPLDSICVWTRIMGLPDQLRNEPVAKAMASKLGEVLEVELGINGVEYGQFVRELQSLCLDLCQGMWRQENPHRLSGSYMRRCHGSVQIVG